MHLLKLYITNIILQLSLANATCNFYAHHYDTESGTPHVFVVVAEAPHMLYKWDLVASISTASV